METLREELITKKIMLTWEEWWDMNKDIFTVVHNSLDPHKAYEDYVNEMINDYKELRR